MILSASYECSARCPHIPIYSNPEMIVFHSVASEVLVTRGMSSGLSHSTISMVSAYENAFAEALKFDLAES